MAGMTLGFPWLASGNRLQQRVLKAGLFLALFIGLLGSVPGTVHAADCSTGTFSAGGYFFSNYESVEYSPEGFIIHHFKLFPSYADGRSFRFSWSYFDDECSSAGSLGFSQVISLPPGVTDWSVRFTSPSHADIWDDQANAPVTGIDFPERPSYTRVAFTGNIDNGASTFGSRTLKINQNGQAPEFAGTLPLPAACAPALAGSSSGFSQYFFDSYEHAEYVDGLLRVHLRLKTPYNDGRSFGGAVASAAGDCSFTFPFISPSNTSLSAYARYFSFRMLSETHWELWNDETNQPVSCSNCSGDLPAGSKYVIWLASIDGGASTTQTTPFSPVEHTTPVYKECCSSVAFLPGIEGSRLLGDIFPLWPPLVPAHFGDSLSQLALSENGSSVNNVTVDGLVDTFYGTPIYSGLTSFMEAVVASSTMQVNEWKPLAYDWRYSPEKILSDGVRTPSGTVDLVQAIEQLAANSNTGKVTLLAHSYGGLVGKELIKKLIDKGEGDLVDSFVMVGSPQLGTPQAVAGLLHGDDQSIPGGFILPGIIVNPVSVRSIAQNMQSLYDLLPSQRYFNEVSSPVITFDPNASFTQEWRNLWGDSLSNYLNFFAFVTGGGVARIKPPTEALKIPEVLRSDLAFNANTFHSQFDNFTFPPSMRVVQIAGWGVPTTKTVNYANEHLVFQGYETKFSREGDKTVLYKSALASSGESYFFNLFDYNETLKTNAQHRDLLNTDPTQRIVESVIKKETVGSVNFITGVKPSISDIADQLIIRTHSPVTLGVSDAQGNFTGVNPGQDPTSQFLFASEGIPGSTFISSGSDEYVLLPKNGTYSFQLKGVGTGPATIDTGILSNDTVVPAVSYSEIPVSPTTNAIFVVDSSAPADTHVQVDQNGDGQVDTYVAPDGQPLSVYELLTNLTTLIQGLNIKDKLKIQLLNKVTAIQKKIDKQKQKQVNVLNKMRLQLQKQADKGKIDSASALQISSLLDDLLAQSALVPLDSGLITQLQLQINVSSLSQAIKDNFLSKIARLQNLAGITKSLTNFTQAVTKKGSKGQIADIDVQNVLNLLDQIQNAL